MEKSKLELTTHLPRPFHCRSRDAPPKPHRRLLNEKHPEVLGLPFCRTLVSGCRAGGLAAAAGKPALLDTDG